MSNPRPSSRLMRWLHREPPPAGQPSEPDAADMGTCFGLEMSLDDAPRDPFSRPETAATHTGTDPETSAPWRFRRTAPGSL
jgi:hypothetical protein